jgi:hypothetical protein
VNRAALAKSSHGARSALFALAVQFALSFGHFRAGRGCDAIIGIAPRPAG